MNRELVVFGYGSLMYEPPRPDALLGMEDGTLEGWARGFEKRSLPRGCLSREALLPQGLPGWVEGAHRVSLCLGVSPADGVVRGKILRWSGTVAEEVLALLDRREGVSRPASRSDGYRALEHPVQTARGTVSTRVYVTRPTSPMYVPELDEAGRADVLVHATPRVRGSKARGAEYLLDAVETLHRVGVVDEGLEGLAARVQERLASVR